MDFMKVFDLTVREIKREVNLKVLKVPEIEQKVLDATDDEPWGPHGSVLAEIAQATKKFAECQMVMNVLWTRLGETGKNWRFVYKSLAVIEYLVANGSERAVDDIIEHTFQISSLSSFEYVEPNGKDNGINVRKKVENILALLNDKEKIQQARNKAAANRDKYIGLSSTGITFKSSSTSLGSSSSMSGDRYGGFGNTKDGESFRDSYKERDRSSEDKFDKSESKSRRGVTVNNQEKKNASTHYGSNSQDSSATGSSKPKAKITDSDKYATVSSEELNAPSNNNEDDFDDFDPRGLSSSKAAAATISPQVDLLGDLMDAPVSVAMEKSFGNNSYSEEVDLFADASFVSAPPHHESGGDYQSESKVDLFASQPVSSSVPPAVDLFATPNRVPQPENKPSESGPNVSKAVDPFASVPLNNFDGSDLFGAFTSPTESVSMDPTQNSINGGGLNNLNENTKATANTPAKKDAFQVKSGIWADSLSRGLIDLNISAPKKVNLSDVGIVGGLTDGSEEKYKGPTTSFYMGGAMGSGTGLGKSSGFTSTPASASSSATDLDDFFSSISSQQNQFGGFQK